MKERYHEVLKGYENVFGPQRALAIEDKLVALKEKVISENDAILAWLPERKKIVTLETLLHKTYEGLISEMEAEMEQSG